MHICVCVCVCVLKSIQIKPGWRQPSQAKDKLWREWISSESVSLIWPARSEIQQLCLDMMNCMCRTQVFTEQTTERQKEKKAWKGEHRSKILLFLTNTLWKNATTKSLYIAEHFEQRSNQDNSSEREQKMSGKRERECERMSEKKRGKMREMHCIMWEGERANEVRKPLRVIR